MGIGIQNADSKLHVKNSNADDTFLLVENTNGAGQRVGLKMINQGTPGTFWTTEVVGLGDFVVTRDASGGAEFTIFKDAVLDERKVGFKDGGTFLMEIQADGDVRAAGTFTTVSDRNAKTDIDLVDTREVLKQVSKIPISTWRYKNNTNQLHMGPMGQDFYAAFGLHEGPTTVSVSDLAGVALASVKGLNEAIEEKDLQIQELLYRVAALEERLVQD